MLFTPPPRQFYRVESGPCWDALVSWRERRREIDAQCFDFAKSVGGVGFYAGHDDNVGNALAISAVTFANGELPKGWKPRKWKSLVPKEGTQPAWPDERTKAGRELLSQIRALPLRPYAGRVCDGLSIPHGLTYSKEGEYRVGCDMLGYIDAMSVGWHQDTFYVGLPRFNEEIEKKEAQGYTVETPRWSPLEGMEPILKEEMDLDFARAKLAEAA